MWALLPVLIRAIAQVLALVGIGWFAWKLERAGGFDQVARAVTGVADTVGDVAGQPEPGGTSSGGPNLLPILLALAAVYFLRR